MYTLALLSLPVTRSTGEQLSHEEVVNQLDDNTVSYHVSLGYNGSFLELLRINFKVELQNYEVAVAWLRDLMFGSHFNKERYN